MDGHYGGAAMDTTRTTTFVSHNKVAGKQTFSEAPSSCKSALRSGAGPPQLIPGRPSSSSVFTSIDSALLFSHNGDL
ncbi:hypothetical protein V6N13_045378 [Hibiscus sabdariffa]